MCGVCGVVDLDETPDLDLVRAMTARLDHRGPDGHGWFRDDRAALGHTRLAIIDTGAGGAQPMSNGDGSVWVTFNGEIFNYVELRRTLRDRGHEFRTASDTEVIVHAWEEWGPGCFDRFNGQWAIGLWDRRTRRLVLCRDRLGVRPLYYARTGSRLAFASEVKALFADPRLDRSLDPAGLAEVFTYWSTVAPRTAFASVEQLPPGHLAVFDEDGLRVEPYWSITFPDRAAEPGQDLRANAAELRERLIEAARLRFVRSDVPVGVYLSGGLDSSVIAAVVARYTDVPLHTFSVRFSDTEFDEGGYQAQMVRELGTEHAEVTVTPGDVARVFPEVVWHAETPLVRAGPAPLFLLSRLAHDHGYKVVVTGEGADEVLAGYDLFREAQVRRFWARQPDSARRGRGVELLYPWMRRNPGRAPAFSRSFFGQDLDPDDPAFSHRPRWTATAALLDLLHRDRREAAPRADLVAAMPPESAAWDPLSRDQWLELTTLLPGYILSSQGDRMLMSNSVEGRFPFLDREVVAFAAQLPARHKLFGIEEKHVLKQAFADLVPASIIHRPKQPYRAPDASSFFAGAPADWFAEVTSEAAVADAGIFDPGSVRGLFAKCAARQGRGMSNTDNMRVLAVVSTQLLHHQFVTRDAASSGASYPIRTQRPSVAVDWSTAAGDAA